MAYTGNTQQQINYGSSANDGQGDPLRSAFIKTDDNFDALWATGPVGSNITIVNNTVQVMNTNGNLVLRPNGVGVIQANAAVVPNATDLRDLGSADIRFRAAYIGTGGLEVTGNITANTFFGNGSQLTGITSSYGNANVATLLAAFGSNTISTTGNVSASNFVGNGALLTGITSSYNNANVTSLLAAFGSNTLVTTGNVSASNFVGNGALLTGITSSYGNANVVANLAALGTNSVVTTGNITANTFFGNGSQLTGIPVNYSNANVATFLAAFGSNSISTTGNITANTAGFAIGYRDIPQISFTGNATLAAGDAGKHFYSIESTNFILTIANNASQDFQVGAAITIVNQGTGNIVVAQASGVTLFLAGNAAAGNRTVSTFGLATCVKVATDTWFITGTGVS